MPLLSLKLMNLKEMLDSDLLGDDPIIVLVHVLEELLQRGLLTHELLEAQSPIKVTVHPREELCDLLPVIFT